MNVIGNIQFDFRMQNEQFARDLYSRWDSFYAKYIEPVVDDVLSRYDNPAEMLEINCLKLDLKQLLEEDFELRFPAVFREKLEDELARCIYYHTHAIQNTAGVRVSRGKIAHYLFELLACFLLHGILPSTTPHEYGDIRKLFAEVSRQNSAELKKFLFTYGHYTSLQERLVYQFGDSALEQTIALLEPGSGDFIISYVKLLRATYKKIAQPGINESNYRNTVWCVVYAYMLGNQGSWFSRKHFVMQTILRLAARYNTTYINLLSYFRQHDTHAQLPYYLNKWLDELYRQETGYRNREPADAPYPLLLAKDKSGFILYIQPLLRLLPAIRDFFAGEMKKSLPDEQLVEFLLNLSAVYKTLSLADMTTRFMEWLHKLVPSVHRPAFYRKMDDLSDKHPLLSAAIHKNNTYFFKDKPINNPQKQETMETTENVQVHNAGLVLLSPFLPRLYAMSGLTGGQAFKDREAQIKAIYFIQYAAFGRTDFFEHELVLNKMLTGLETNEAIPAQIELTGEEKNTIVSMLEGVKQNWSKLKNTGTEGLRQAFLQRDGKSEDKEDHYLLTVEAKAYDLLLDSVPWNFRMIKHPWMKKMIRVKWR